MDVTNPLTLLFPSPQYVPYVADSKRAMDEYTSEIFMGGRNTIVMHNTCEDSLLAAPIILDLVLLAELVTRIQLAKGDEELHNFHPVAVLLSYLTKAPLVSDNPCLFCFGSLCGRVWCCLLFRLESVLCRLELVLCSSVSFQGRSTTVCCPFLKFAPLSKVPLVRFFLFSFGMPSTFFLDY